MYETMVHSPNLKTIVMVEETLAGMNESVISIADLKRLLPKQVNHTTLMEILHYLESSNKIAVSLKGISWIFAINQNVKNAISKGLEL